jgi:CRP-like cAMP-binding protein
MADNRILSRLSRADLNLLEPHLKPVDLPVRKQLEARKKRIDHVYFIESGFASVVANGTKKPGIEVGIIGREGLTGLAVVLGDDRAQHETYMQVGGKGRRISAAHIRRRFSKARPRIAGRIIAQKLSAFGRDVGAVGSFLHGLAIKDGVPSPLHVLVHSRILCLLRLLLIEVADELNPPNAIAFALGALLKK